MNEKYIEYYCIIVHNKLLLLCIQLVSSRRFA